MIVRGIRKSVRRTLPPILALLAVALVFSGLGQVIAASPDSKHFGVREVAWESLEKPQGAPPGAQRAKLVVGIQNIHDQDMYNIVGRLELEDPFRDIHGATGIAVADTISKLNVGGAGSLEYFLNIAPDAVMREYDLTLEISYVIPPAKRGSESHEITVSIQGTSDVRVSLNTNEVNPGRNALTLTVRNVGDTVLYNGKVSIAVDPTSSSFASLQSDASEIPIGVLELGQSERIPFALIVAEGPQASIARLRVDLSFKDAYSLEVSKSVNLGLTVISHEPRPRIVLKADRAPPSPTSGQEVALDLELGNIGERDAKGVKVKVLPASPFIGLLGFDEVFLQGIQASQTAEASFDLLVDGSAPSGPYSISVAVSYTDDQGTHHGEEFSLGLKVSGLMVVKLINLDVPESALPGEEVAIMAEVLVIGTETAQFVELTIDREEGPLISRDYYQYLGAVDPDSPIPVQISFEVELNATEGSHDIPLRISYLDSFNQAHEATANMSIYVESARPQPSDEIGGSEPGVWQRFVEFLKRLIGISP